MCDSKLNLANKAASHGGWKCYDLLCQIGVPSAESSESEMHVAGLCNQAARRGRPQRLQQLEQKPTVETCSRVTIWSAVS